MTSSSAADVGGQGNTISGFIHAISGMNVGSSMSDKLHDLTYLPSAAIMRISIAIKILT